MQAVQLPEADDARTLARMRKRCGGALAAVAPAAVARVIERVQSALAGCRDGLLDVPLDWDGVPPFHRRVYEAARRVSPGSVVTYGQMARDLGDAGASRAVGQALGHNPFAPIVPCHRILAANGASGGFSAEGGARTKLRLLEIEGAVLGLGHGLFDA
ncbi:MAG: methylated-DNA--[protein]-cysteine S-methyltransferase [Ramlibacter sp.]